MRANGAILAMRGEPDREAGDSSHKPLDAESGPGLREAAHEALGVVEFTASRIRSTREALVRLDSPLLVGVGLLLIAAAFVGMTLVLLHPFRDWYMHLAFYACMIVFWLLYVKAHLRRRSLRAWLFGSSFGVMACAWAAVAWDLGGPRRVWFGAEVLLRPEIREFRWISAGMSASALLLLLHAAGVRWFWSRVRKSQRQLGD